MCSDFNIDAKSYLRLCRICLFDLLSSIAMEWLSYIFPSMLPFKMSYKAYTITRLGNNPAIKSKAQSV